MRRLAAVAALLFVVLAASPARAELIRITPTGMTPAEYQAAGLPLDPAIIGSGGFRLTYWGGGSDTLINPVEIILATPTGATAPPLTKTADSGFTSVTVDLGDSTMRYGGTWNTSTGFAGTFSSSSSTDKVYDLIGFTPQGSDSQNYSNWNGATGLTSWNLFVYAITFDPLMSQGSWVEFSTNLSAGSYVIGYGQVTDGKPASDSTPFTFAGMVQTVPEPSTLVLNLSGAGFVMLFAGFARRRKAVVRA